MSIMICVAADMPPEKLENPHMKLMSIREAVEQGLNVPQSLLADPETDADDPEGFLWSDICVEFDPETGNFSPEPEDNFDIWPIDCADGLQTEKPYLAAVEWGQCTPVRAELLADYLRRETERMGEIELWKLWCGVDVELTRVHRREIRCSELTAGDVLTLCESEVTHPKALGPTEVWTQFCLVIRK